MSSGHSTEGTTKWVDWLREYKPGEAEKFLTTYHERDQETGLDYRGARFYDSDVGRFLSLDPLAGDFAAWSPYNYVLGNPVSFIDPDGRQAESIHLDQDGNVIADIDDGDDGVYQHVNGTTEADIVAHNYYESGNTGRDVTDGGGTQIGGLAVSITARKHEEVIQKGVRATFIIGVGITTSRGRLYDEHGNENKYVDFGIGWGLDVGLGVEKVIHTTTPRIPLDGDTKFENSDLEGFGVMKSFSIGPFGGASGGSGSEARDFHYFGDWGNSYKSESMGLFKSQFKIGASNTSSELFITN